MTVEKSTVDVRQARTNTHLRVILAGSLIAIAVAGWLFMLLS
ncbi:MAG: hypothetical protein AAFO73_02620 [Pseudomonadota bacterium]